jgi:hypothetical protein
MKRKRSAGITVLLTTDGSRQAHAALELAAAFPWGKTARAHLVLREEAYHSDSGGLTSGSLASPVLLTGLSSASYREPAGLFDVGGPRSPRLRWTHRPSRQSARRREAGERG